jgi:hypothetical protein
MSTCKAHTAAPYWSPRDKTYCELVAGHPGRHRETFDSGRVTWHWDDLDEEAAVTITGEGS